MYSDEQQNESLLKGRNAFRTLEKMSYTNYDDFESCRQVLDEKGFVCANVFYEDQEYYFCLKKIPAYDWLMLFMVHADSVAADTMAMVNSIIQTFVLLAVIALLTLCAIFFIWYRSRRTLSLYEFELKSNERLSEINQHLLGLINDVLDMSKIEAGKMKLSPEEENIEDIIENVEVLVRPQTMAKRQEFDVVVTNVKHKMVMADKLRLNQVLLNLLSNAVKYTPQGGKICLSVEELPQRSTGYANYRIQVADNGYSMSEEYLKDVFQVFTREEDTRINKIQGSGLGLAITKNLVDLMGGNISVRGHKSDPKICLPDGTEDTNRGYDSQCLCGGYS